MGEKTYHTKLYLKVFINKQYNGKGAYDVMSSTMDGNKQKGKWLTIKHSSLKWINANNAPHKRSPWQIPTANGMIVTLLTQL